MPVPPFSFPVKVKDLGLPFELHFFGPHLHNGAFYVFLGVTVGSLATTHPYPYRFAMMKSIDNGVSWNEMDSANSPQFNQKFDGPFGADGNCAGCFFDTANASVDFAFMPFVDPDPTIAQPLSLCSFSMATDTYGALITGGPNVDAVACLPVITIRLSTGTIVVFYGPPDGSILWARYFGGAWHDVDSVVKNPVGSFAFCTYGGAILDSSDRILLPFANEAAGTDSNNAGWVAQWVAGVVTNTMIRQTTGGGLFFTFNEDQIGVGKYMVARDEYVFPFVESFWNGSASSDRFMLARGSPAAAPSWTFETIESPFLKSGPDDSPAVLVKNLAESKLYVWIVDDVDNIDPIHVGKLLYYEQDTPGSWNAPVVAYDDNVGQLPDPAIPFFSNLLSEHSISLLDDAPTFAVSFGLEAEVSEFGDLPANWVVQYFMTNRAAAPPPSVDMTGNSSALFVIHNAGSPPPPPPPPTCIIQPISTPVPSLVLYPEPNESKTS